MKRKFNFGKIDYFNCGKANNLVEVDIEYKEDRDKKRFSASARVWNSCHSDIVAGGQCLDDIAPYIDNPTFREILRLWKLYHLNDMHPECHHQNAMGWREKATEKVVLHTFTLISEVISKQNSIKRAIMSACILKGSVSIADEEKFILALEYSITTHKESLPKEIAQYYKLSKSEVKTLGWLRENEHPDGILCKPCPVCGYKYGSSWVYFPIPKDDERIIIKLLRDGELW